MSAPNISGSLHVAIAPTSPIYTDDGSGADLNLAIYRPTSIPDGWCYLGDLALQMPVSHPYPGRGCHELDQHAAILARSVN